MRIIIDTQNESKEGIAAAIRMLKALLEEMPEIKSSEKSQKAPELSIMPQQAEEEKRQEELKIENGFINILSGDELVRVGKEDKKDEEDLNFETY
ncbi:MAG: hypothetical protein QXJ50_04045 [Candidatus Woesearchaeota archaeon]